MSGGNQTTYGNEKEKNFMKECVICMIDYKDTDDITELPCNEKHFFHTSCVEVLVRKKPECPLCRSPLHLD